MAAAGPDGPDAVEAGEAEEGETDAPEAAGRGAEDGDAEENDPREAEEGGAEDGDAEDGDAGEGALVGAPGRWKTSVLAADDSALMNPEFVSSRSIAAAASSAVAPVRPASWRFFRSATECFSSLDVLTWSRASAAGLAVLAAGAVPSDFAGPSGLGASAAAEFSADRTPVGRATGLVSEVALALATVGGATGLDEPSDDAAPGRTGSGAEEATPVPDPAAAPEDWPVWASDDPAAEDPEEPESVRGPLLPPLFAAGFLSDSLLPLPDLRTVVSSSAAVLPASSASSDTGSLWFSTRPSS